MSFQFEDLMNMAESNAIQGEKKVKQSLQSQVGVNKVKRVDPKEKKLSEGVQRFLQKKAQEEKRLLEQKKVQKEKLMELRYQDKKAHRRVNSMLRMTKSANKACIADAKNSFSDALAEQNEIQPDEDDYGYVSQSSQEWHKKLMEKYKQTPPSKPNRRGPPPAPIPAPQSLPKSKSSSNSESKEEEDVECKQSESSNKNNAKNSKKRPPPEAMNFQTLLELANQKAQEPVAFNAFKSKKSAQEKETFEFGRPMTAKEKAQYLQEKEYERRIQAGRVGISDKSSSSSNKNSNTSTSSPSTTNGKGEFKIPSLNKKNGTSAISSSKSSQERNGGVNDNSSKNRPKPPHSVSQNIPPSSTSSAQNNNKRLQSSSSSSSSSPPSQSQQHIRKSSDPYRSKDITKSDIPSRKQPLPHEKSRIPPPENSRPKYNNSDIRSQSMSKSKPMSAMPENRSRLSEVDRHLPQKSRDRSPPVSRLQPGSHRGRDSRSPPRSKQPPPRADRDDSPIRRRPPPPPGHNRPGQRPPQKRRQVIESDEEYDSEMDDFIADDDEEGGINYSDMIRAITGYDRNKYKHVDEDDIQESSVFEQWKEEQRSARIGLMEDLEDMRQEEEEKKRKLAMKKKVRR